MTWQIFPTWIRGKVGGIQGKPYNYMDFLDVKSSLGFLFGCWNPNNP